MKRFQKLTALALAGVMTMSVATTAFATAVTGPPGSGDSGSVTGPGSVLPGNPRMMDITLPTGASLGFNFDPSGFSQATPGQSVNDLQGGLIVPADANSTAAVINNSSFPIALRANFVADYGTIQPTFVMAGANVATARTTVNTGNGNNLLLYVVPSVANAPVGGGTPTPWVPGMRGFGLNTTPRDLHFFLDSADWVVNAAGTAVEAGVADSGSGVQFRVGGFINPAADWSVFTGTDAIGVTAVFHWNELPFNAEPVGTAVENVAHLRQGTVATGTVPGTATNGAPGALPWNVMLGTEERVFMGWTAPAAGFGASPGTPTRANLTATVGAAVTVPFHLSGGVTIVGVELGSPVAAMANVATGTGWRMDGSDLSITFGTANAGRPTTVILSDGRRFTFTAVIS